MILTSCFGRCNLLVPNFIIYIHFGAINFNINKCSISGKLSMVGNGLHQFEGKAVAVIHRKRTEYITRD